MILIFVLVGLVRITQGGDYSDYFILPERGGGGPNPLTSPRPSPAILTSYSPNVSVSVGERAVLSCRVAHTSMNTVSWVRHSPDTTDGGGSPRLLSVGNFVFVRDKRVEVAEGTATGDWVLVIKRSSMDDSGWYECQVNTNPHTSHTIYLSVQEPNSYIEGKKEVFVDAGSTSTITCRVDSPTPPHHIFWYFNGQPYDPGEKVVVSSSLQESSSWSKLEILSATQDQSGLYECRPSNSNSSSVQLTVLAGKMPAELHQTTVPSIAANNHSPSSPHHLLLLTLLGYLFSISSPHLPSTCHYWQLS